MTQQTRFVQWRAGFREFRASWEYRMLLVWFAGRAVIKMARSDAWITYDKWYQDHGRKLYETEDLR